MTSFIRPWPYAALAIVHYQHVPPALDVWVTFRHPMDTSVKPPLAKWILKADGVQKAVQDSEWIDAYTIRLDRGLAGDHREDITLAYNGPDENLRTTWDKQWEPFGPIQALDVSYNWETILVVDVLNARVTINGVFLLTTKTWAAGGFTNVDVSDKNIIFLDNTAGAITINSLANGINGQILYFPLIAAAGNNVTMKHVAGTPGQQIYCHAMADEILNGEYGGWILVCNGTSWFDISHAKHV